MARLKAAVLISGRGSNMVALLDSCADPAFPAEIVTVISNRPGAAGLARAEAAGIPTRVIDHRAHPGREDFEASLTAALEEVGAELVCLAGFMRLLTPGFVDRWAGRMVNIHPSLLPAFKGLHVHEQALAAGVRVTGCTVHYVTAEMDDGPIIAQAAVPVMPGDTPDALAARVLVAEHKAYPMALKLVAEGRARMGGGEVELDGTVWEQEVLLSPPR
ncbi:phosphoribosylglycinamide formyltransferase [Inquilinus sp. CAU 1745]|uniref:phosphoribosylglycinamide formyltransferase n=1 Tax=Inquilinus sp. CAU 1745 TaxID=3140369 RepID=UPI00325BC018